MTDELPAVQEIPKVSASVDPSYDPVKLWNQVHIEAYAFLGTGLIARSIVNNGFNNAVQNPDVQAAALLAGLSISTLLLQARARFKKLHALRQEEESTSSFLDSE